MPGALERCRTSSGSSRSETTIRSSSHLRRARRGSETRRRARRPAHRVGHWRFEGRFRCRERDGSTGTPALGTLDPPGPGRVRCAARCVLPGARIGVSRCLHDRHALMRTWGTGELRQAGRTCDVLLVRPAHVGSAGRDPADGGQARTPQARRRAAQSRPPAACGVPAFVHCRQASVPAAACHRPGCLFPKRGRTNGRGPP